MPNKDHLRSPELEKLAEKFRKDPSGKLFFPLAEEYAKIGLVDDAISLLRTGIQAHPHLLSARVALGKALLSKGMEAEARAEFEQVVLANPDNILAHKKLAGLYVKARDRVRALASCQAVLAVNPADPDVLRIRDDAERLVNAPPDATDESTQVDTTLVEPTLVDPTLVDRTVTGVQAPRDEDAEPTTVSRAMPQEVINTAAMDKPSEAEPTVVAFRAPDGEPDPLAEPSDHEDDLPGYLPDIEPTLIDPTVKMLSVKPAPSDVPVPVFADEGAEAPGTEEDDGLATVSMADLFIAQGHYQRGIDIYRRILDRSPDHAEAAGKLENAITLQRLLSPQRSDDHDVKADLLQQVLGKPRVVESEENPPADLVGAVVGEPSSRNDAAIRRLEAWLARIAERRRA